MKKIKERKENSKGITLIALVITIVVLLILAGVTISLIVGENGILNQATTATGKSKKAELKEKVDIAVQAAMARGLGTLTYENLVEELNSSIETYQIQETANGWSIVSGEYEFEISKVGDVELIGEAEESIETGDLDLLERYVLGENKNGRNITEIADMTNYTFINEASTIYDANTSIKILAFEFNEDSSKILYI